MRARKVRQATLDMISKHVDVDDIYITKTIEQSDQSLDEIIQKRYPLVLCGGGDGTAMRIVEQMRLKVGRLNQAGGDYRMPRFGLLKLGTGNGWAGLLETPPKVEPIWALRQRREDELKFTAFNMIQCDERLFHFGGFGLDAMILNNYIELKNKFSKGFMWKVSNSMAGYLYATFFQAAPRLLRHKYEVKARVINNADGPIYRAYPHRPLEQLTVKKGETIFEGPVMLVGAATTSNYGFNLKTYPYACLKPGYMNLRTALVSIPATIWNIRQVWKGVWNYDGIKDWLVQDVIIETETDMPFQLGGDPEGYRNRVRFQVSDFTVDVLDFRK